MIIVFGLLLVGKSLKKWLILFTRIWIRIMEVKIKQELINLDRNDLMAVSQLVDKIVFDLSDLLVIGGDELMLEAAKDYMIDLINPDLLDFDNYIRYSI
jgi:hypothetical protein